MIHIRIDSEPLNINARFACGLVWPLPESDVYFDEEERTAAYLATHPQAEVCPGCFPGGRPQLGTPISELSGRPGHRGYEQFRRIAESWGYD